MSQGIWHPHCWHIRAKYLGQTFLLKKNFFLIIFIYYYLFFYFSFLVSDLFLLLFCCHLFFVVGIASERRKRALGTLFYCQELGLVDISLQTIITPLSICGCAEGLPNLVGHLARGWYIPCDNGNKWSGGPKFRK